MAVNEAPVNLQEGELYVMKNGRLQHVEREGDLPKVPISEAAKEALLLLRKACRRTLNGFRPDLALVASALIEHTAARPDALAIVQAYLYASLETGKKPQASVMVSLAADNDADPRALG